MSTQPEEHDALWVLLGKAKQPSLPASFAEQVHASISALDSGSRESISTKRHWGWLTAGLGIAAALLFSVSNTLMSPTSNPTEDDTLLAALNDHHFSSGDLTLLTHLDEVIDAELAALWNESL